MYFNGTKIHSIMYGAKSNKTIDIDEDGIYDVSKYSKANVSVSGENEVYYLKVVDYDGTLLDEKTLSNGDVYTLPTPPTHNGLTFQEWVSNTTIINNTITINNNNVIVGPTYTTTSGLTELDIKISKVSGLSFSLPISGITSVDWGDGTTDTSSSHTYSSYGDYTIKMNCTTMSTFTNNDNIYALRIGSSINTFYFGFDGCSNFKAITIPNTIQTFLWGSYARSCRNLLCIIFPSNLTSIYSSFNFNGSPSLKYVILNKNISSLPSAFFIGCYNLTFCALPDNITSIGQQCFQQTGIKDIVFPSGITSVSKNTFEDCPQLENVIFKSQNVISIGTSSFEDCYSLKKIKSSVGFLIDYKSFRNCYSLKNIKLASSLTSIPQESFYGCLNLSSIEIPDNVTSIGQDAFNGCYNLKEINIPNGITSIGNQAFISCRSLKNITIPNTLTTIGNWVFAYCYSLETITSPKFPTTYGFRECYNLKTIVSTNATSVGGYQYQFYNCYSLKNVNIPVRGVANYCYWNCNSLLEYDFSTYTSVPTLSNVNCFTNINPAAKIIVPDDLYESWIVATNWATYANNIYKVSEVSQS